MRYLAGTEEEDAIMWMKKASHVAGKALCLRAYCGTVIVKEGIIIGEGYNAPPLDDVANRTCLTEYRSIDKKKYDRTCCMHAEWRAIMDAVRRAPGLLTGSRLYFSRIDSAGDLKKSGKPFCTVCSRLALDSGIVEFLLWHEEGICAYPTDEYNRLSYGYGQEVLE